LVSAVTTDVAERVEPELVSHKINPDDPNEDSEM
jgi:hypothetical protein